MAGYEILGTKVFSAVSSRSLLHKQNSDTKNTYKAMIRTPSQICRTTGDERGHRSESGPAHASVGNVKIEKSHRRARSHVCHGMDHCLTTVCSISLGRAMAADIQENREERETL